MSDSGSIDSLSQCCTPELRSEDTSPLQSELIHTERPILSKLGKGVKFGDLLEMQLETPEVKQTPTTTTTTTTTSGKHKRRFLKKGEGIARFTPAGAKLRKKQVASKQTPSSRDQLMKRKVANEIPKITRKPLPKRIPQLVQASAPIDRRPDRDLSPIPYTPPSYMNRATNSSHFQTPPLSSGVTPRHISFKTDNQLSMDYNYTATDSPSQLASMPSDDSVVMVFMRNEMQQQEDLKEFQALEALVEAQANGHTSFDFDINSPMDSPNFHALGKKAQQYLLKRKSSHINSPVSAANSSGYQNPLNNARVGDDEEWDEYLGDEIETQESWIHSPEVRATEELAVLPVHEESVLDSKKEEIRLQTEKEDRSVSNLIQDRVQELENEITEYQRLNGVMKRQEGERQREQSELRLKLDEFEEYRKSELDRMEKDYQSQMYVVKRERQRLEQYKQNYHSSEAKLLKQEIEILREQLTESQDTLRDKETKNRTLVLRLKNNVRQAEFERDELKNQVALIESLRLKQWEESADQYSGKQHVRTKLKFDRIPSEEDLTRYKYEGETTELFSESSASIESDNNEGNEKSIIDNIIHLHQTKYSDGASKPHANSTAMPSFVDKLSEKLLPDNSTEITYFNNTRKVISPNGKLVTLYLSNGDIKTNTADKTVYFYAENSTKYTKFKNGEEVFEYSTGQRETNRPDGSKEIIFPDGNKVHIFPDGSEKVTCKDGTIQKKSADASTTIIWHPDGFVDTITREFKKREFTDGTCKIVFKDGTNETRYPSGRVRIKTAEGKVTHDGIIDK